MQKQISLLLLILIKQVNIWQPSSDVIFPDQSIPQVLNVRHFVHLSLFKGTKTQCTNILMSCLQITFHHSAFALLSIQKFHCVIDGEVEGGLLISQFDNRLLSSHAPRYYKTFDWKAKATPSSSKGNNMFDLNSLRDKFNLKSELQYN